MNENVSVHPLAMADLANLSSIDHSFHTDFVWQMKIDQNEGHITAKFREVRLPRSMHVDYPKDINEQVESLKNKTMTYVAKIDTEPIGYISLDTVVVSGHVLVTDVVVTRRLRRQGIGTVLVLAAQRWARDQGISQIQLEMQSKNHPAIRLATKLGYEFCGYCDRHYANQDIALYFSKRL